MKKKMLLLSIDAMVTEDLEILRTLPAFSEVLEGASVVKNIQSVYPTLTHPAHVSIVTGCYPDRHGIITNDEFRPGERFSPWLERADLVKVPMLPQVARTHGYTVASVFWPLTIGMEAEWVLGRDWVHEKRRTQQQTIADNSTPGLFDEVADSVKSCWGKEHYEEADSFCFLSAEYLLRTYRPDLTMIHVILMDHIRHAYGVFSPKLREGYEIMDRGLARLLSAMRDAGTYDDTIICLTSDHGQLDVERVAALNRFFLEQGLIRLNPDGTLRDYDAYAHAASLVSLIHVGEAADRDRVRALLLENRERLGIGQLFTREETKKLRLDGDFTFVAETDGRTAFSPRWDTEVVTAIDPADWRTSVAGHGHLPWKGAKPMFIVKDPRSREACTLESGRLVDEAPTMARLLGFDLPGCDGAPIPELLG